MAELAEARARRAPPRQETLGQLWRERARAAGEATAYLVETDAGWRPVSWSLVATRVEELAHGLLDLGLRRGDRLAILGSTGLEWVLLDWAALALGLVVVPVYPTSAPEEVAYVLGHSRSRALLAEDAAQRDALDAAALPALEHVLAFSDLDALAARGRARARSDPDALDRAAAAVSPLDVATCVYTSGTTGAPKGCLLTHANYTAALAMVQGALGGLLGPGDSTVLYLPLAHVFGRLVHLGCADIGYSIALCGDVGRVAAALEQVRPTFLVSVPRMFEKIHAAVLAQLEAAGPVRRAIGRRALQLGRRASALRRSGEPLLPVVSVPLLVADRLVFARVRRRLGGRLRFAISGGAPLAPEIGEFFDALGLTVLEGYGLTESTAVGAVSTPDRLRFGTVGPPMPGCEVRIAPDGEILLRGPHVFAGYEGDEEATRAVLDADGWLATGDVGRLDGDGFLAVTDRKKDLIVTAGGKNVPPQNLENELRSSRYVAQALVVGDRRPYVVALLTLDEAEVTAWARALGLEGGVEQLAATPEVQRLLEEHVGRVNERLARYAQVKRFAVLPRDFGAAEGEVTPTLKLRRRVCEQHFAAEIEALYATPRAPQPPTA